MIAKFETKGFAKAGYVRLGGGINRKIGNGKISGERAEIEDGSALRDQGGKKGVGKVGEGLHVEADHLFRFFPFGSTKLAVVSHPGVVDEEVGIEFLRRKGIDEMNASFGIGEVGGEDLDLELGVCRNQLLRDVFKNLLPSGDEDEGLDVRSELAGVFQPQTGTGPGNEGAAEIGAGVRFHK